MPSHHTSQPSPHAPSVGLSQSSSTKRISCKAGSMPSTCRLSDKAVGYCLATASKSPETGNNAESDWGFRHSARRLVGARVAHKPHSRLRPKRTQNRGRMKRAGTHFHVIRLQYHATLIGPILLQAQYQVLKRVLGNFVCFGHGLFPTRIFPTRYRNPHYRAKLTTRSGKASAAPWRKTASASALGPPVAFCRIIGGNSTKGVRASRRPCTSTRWAPRPRAGHRLNLQGTQPAAHGRQQIIQSFGPVNKSDEAVGNASATPPHPIFQTRRIRLMRARTRDVLHGRHPVLW